MAKVKRRKYEDFSKKKRKWFDFYSGWNQKFSFKMDGRVCRKKKL